MFNLPQTPSGEAEPAAAHPATPAATNVLFGVLAAEAWRRRPQQAVALIAAGGLLLAVAGLGLDRVFPINKRLWTSSFTLFSGGVSGLGLAAAAILVRVPLARRKRRSDLTFLD